MKSIYSVFYQIIIVKGKKCFHESFISFRDEIDFSNDAPKRGEKLPGREFPRKPNSYNVAKRFSNTEEQLSMKSLDQLKSMDKSQGTPTSQVTIVENTNTTTNTKSVTIRPPLLRKPNEV